MPFGSEVSSAVVSSFWILGSFGLVIFFGVVGLSFVFASCFAVEAVGYSVIGWTPPLDSRAHSIIASR